MLGSKVEFDPAPSVSSHEILGPSAKRRLLHFSPPAIGRVTLSNFAITADGAGFVLTAGQGHLKLDIEEYGEVVTQPWFALYSSGASAVGWIQAIG